MVNKILKVTDLIGKSITNAVKKVNSSVKAMVSAIDLLRAEGFKSTNFISPQGKKSKSTSSQEMFDQLKSFVILGFDLRIQKLLDLPTKSLTDKQKTDKRYWQQQIGARMADFRTALEKREKGSGGNSSKPRTAEQRVRDNLNDALKVINNIEDEKQLVKGEEIKSLLKQAINLIPCK